jgi:hypothetical protein
LWSSIPIAAPMANVTTKHIPNVTSFGCVVTISMILDFNDIIKSVSNVIVFNDIVEKLWNYLIKKKSGSVDF